MDEDKSDNSSMSNTDIIINKLIKNINSMKDDLAKNNYPILNDNSAKIINDWLKLNSV
jgi:hypothetical protein